MLIANRGEIAARIIRTCKRLGISTVAVYSDADRNAVHVKMADASVHIGRSNPIKSYLCPDLFLGAMVQSGADAVHPGYGFLSEDANFAKSVQERGATWIGPSPEVMTTLSSKVQTRRIASEAGIPIIPGTLEKVDLIGAEKAVGLTGLPLMLKADHGGGGKGVKKVKVLGELKAAYDSASREALYSFGDAGLYVEKALDRPSHIEVQILADRRGGVVALGERDCSMQRRCQKVIEESPATKVDEAQRREIFELAKRFVRKTGYVNAGTVEFLLDRETGDFYLMEVNKRIQVEHPVTELTTGIDIVEEQIKIASGMAITMNDDASPSGHAIECRIFAEDPDSFLPSPGMITELDFPSDDRVRVDHALEPNTVLSPYYDPLIAKVIARGETRGECIEALEDYLRAMKIGGIKTNMPFLLKLISNPRFRSGDYHTAFIDDMLSANRGVATGSPGSK